VSQSSLSIFDRVFIPIPISTLIPIPSALLIELCINYHFLRREYSDTGCTSKPVLITSWPLGDCSLGHLKYAMSGK
jgi:hypothetical protein